MVRKSQGLRLADIPLEGPDSQLVTRPRRGVGGLAISGIVAIMVVGAAVAIAFFPGTLTTIIRAFAGG